MSRDLLIEIGTEDLPARFVRPLAEALAEGVAGGLDEAGIEHADVLSFATPRRIAVRIEAVAESQPPQQIERRGPAVQAAFRGGEPTRAALGFAASCGVELSALERLVTDKGEWLMYRATEDGKATVDLVPGLFEAAIARMDQLVPKRMRWGSGDDTFVRPVSWLLALWGEDLIPLRAFGLVADKRTVGHRFHAPDHIIVPSPGQYESLLQAAHVWPDLASRRDEIRCQIEKRAGDLGGVARIDEDLLDEVAALVEWPVVISGRIEARFLELPPEVLIATIEQHQRYFPVRDADGGLMPAFITVSNIESSDPEQVVRGNERVVTPRLADAMFFWEQDRARPLIEFVPGLDRVTFHKDLGSTGDKVRRVVALARAVAGDAGADADTAARAAELAKADLLTRMVFEFPELQGTMGAYYARAAGEPDAVCDAIAEHYAPTGGGAPIPASAAGRAVALADKLDTLCGIFSVGQAPSGSKDPFALRRAALGALRILIEGRVDLDLKPLVAQALSAQPAGDTGAAMAESILAFLLERLRAVLGVPVEVFNAVAESGVTRPLEFAARVAAVQAFQQLPEAEALAAAHKRARNVLKQAGDEPGAVDEEAFTEAAETRLHEAMRAVDARVGEAVAAGDFVEALKHTATLREDVDAYFDAVMVMAEDPGLQRNRLATMAALDRLCRQVADLAQLPG